MDFASAERSQWLDGLRERDPEAAEAVAAMLEGDTVSLDLEPPAHSEWIDALGSRQSRAGERLGSYELREPIAAGGMGHVFRAVRADDVFEKEVAIKLVKRGMDSDEILRRFRLERQVLAGLEHPGIARLLDGGISPTGQPFLVMELVDGVPIDQFCDQARLGTGVRLRLIQAVCEAVHYAHQHLVVHRDIKPNNVLVTPDVQVKLLDFGVAKVLSDDSAGQDMTAPGAAWLTPEYASPEQLAGKPLTIVSDVYSLGVLMYRLLTGRQPHEFTGQPRHQLERIVLEQEPQRPSEVVTKSQTRAKGDGKDVTEVTPEELAQRRNTNPSKLRGRLMGDLDNIVLHALAKEPERRYSTSKELAEDIERHLTGMPVLARRGSSLYRSAKFLKRNWLAVALSAAAILALITGLVVSSLWYLRANQASERAERRFSQVHDLAKVFLFEADAELESGPGKTAARERMAATALEYLERLTDEADDDAQLQIELAHGYLRLGDLQGGLGTDNLGQSEQARESFARARSLVQGLAESARSAFVSILECRLEIRMGDNALQRAAASDALEHYESAQSISQASEPDAFTDAMEWTIASREVASRLASHLETLGRPAEATVHRRAEVEAARAIAADMRNAPSHHVLANAISDLAGLLERDASPASLEEAKQLRAEMMDMMESWVAQSPGDMQARVVLGAALHAQGRQQAKVGQARAAIETLTRAVAHFQWLSENDPANVESLRNLGVVTTEIGYALAMDGDPEAGLERHREAVAIKARVFALDSNNAMARRGLGIARRATAELLASMRRLDEARILMRDAYTDFEALVNTSPDNGEAQVDMIIADAIMGGIQYGLSSRSKDSAERRLVQATQSRISFERALIRLDELELTDIHAPGQEQLRVPLERDLVRSEDFILELEEAADSGF
ncbi:MAG: serine/threonine protein kinase [Planctomycetota bacterium]|jgi:serine/threonine protein kinase